MEAAQSNRITDQPVVLVVEDEPFQNETLVHMLEAVGAKPLACRSAEAGLALLQEYQIDLVLCDLEMPGIDGFKFLEQARSHLADLPVIAITVHDDPIWAKQAGQVGFTNLYCKPIRLSQLKEEVSKCRRLKQEG